MGSQSDTHYDIVICGGGLVGLMLANLLDAKRFRIALIDAGPEPIAVGEPVAVTNVGPELRSGYSPRVSVFNARSVEMLRRCSVDFGRHLVFSEMRIYDGEGTAELDFEAAEIGASSLGIVIENQLIVQSLFQRLQATGEVDLMYNQVVDELDEEEGVILEEGTSVTGELIVGADGGNSKIRALSGIRAAGWHYAETALVSTIQTEQPHDSIPRQWFTGEGPLAFLPLPDAHLSSIVWSHGDTEMLRNLSASDFCTSLTEASESILGSVQATDKRFTFPLKHTHAYQYTKKGVVLIGDAAHTIHPLAGQGANLGLADAEALARELQQTILTDESPGDIAVLQRFTRERQPHNLAMGAAMETFKRVYGTSIPALGWLRNEGMRFMNRSGPIKSLVMRFAGGQI